MPQQAAAQYAYDYGYMVIRDRAIRILPKRTQAIPRIRPTVGSTTLTAIGAQAATGPPLE
jgi:hypothetical protein